MYAAEMVQGDNIVLWLKWFHQAFPWVGTLCLLMMIDIISGTIASYIHKTISSSASWVGMNKKALMLLAVATGSILEPFAGDVPLGKMVAVFYSITEGWSILENLGRAGVPIPEALLETVSKAIGKKHTVETRKEVTTTTAVSKIVTDEQPDKPIAPVGSTEVLVEESTITKRVKPPSER